MPRPVRRSPAGTPRCARAISDVWLLRAPSALVLAAPADRVLLAVLPALLALAALARVRVVLARLPARAGLLLRADLLVPPAVLVDSVQHPRSRPSCSAAMARITRSSLADPTCAPVPRSS